MPPDSNSKDHDSGSERWLYSLVAMFLILDVVLWAYRLSWLSRQLHAARHGYADRIPTDDACKQVGLNVYEGRDNGLMSIGANCKSIGVSISLALDRQP